MIFELIISVGWGGIGLMQRFLYFIFGEMNIFSFFMAFYLESFVDVSIELILVDTFGFFVFVDKFVQEIIII